MSRKAAFVFLAIYCMVLAACQATGEAPVSEWSVEPAPGIPAGRRADANHFRGDASASPRAPGQNAVIVEGSGRLVGAKPDRHDDGGGEGEADITLNFVALPIQQAAKIMLGEIVAADYVIDPRVEGKISAHTAHPVHKKQALELFQASLRIAGAALVRSGSLYKIVPLDQAATAGVAVSTGDFDAAASQGGDSAKVVQLRYVSASEMKRVLEPMTQHGGILRADDGRNTLSISGSPADLAAMQDVISMFDVDTMRGMSFALVPVNSGDADALAEDLRNVFGSEKEGPMQNMIRFIGNKKLAAILVVSQQAKYIERARAWINRLDARAAGTEKQFFTYRVQNRPAKELVQVLASMFGAQQGAGNAASRFGQQSSLGSGGLGSNGFGQGAGSSTGPLGSLSANGPTSGGSVGGGAGSGLGGGSSSGLGGGLGGGIGGGLGGGGGGGLGGGSLSGTANSANGQSGQQGPQSIALGEDGRYRVGYDEAKNAIVVMSTPEDFRKLCQVIEKLDVLPNQVFIEATIAEVTLNNELQFGVSW
ncbi:MAG TPA: secretin N-terminal domain-containing protein, partial [Methylocystis sp.]|nr:secretin N-terminal domain-containing protein [Methylocystis sp.]